MLYGSIQHCTGEAYSKAIAHRLRQKMRTQASGLLRAGLAGWTKQTVRPAIFGLASWGPGRTGCQWLAGGNASQPANAT